MLPDQLPLKGVRVLDLTRVLAGPLATMMLGDLGADVLKVERPGSGDDSRSWGPPFDERGESAYYLCCNRNKLGIAVDLGDPSEVAFVRSLLAEADVVVDNFRAGTLERCGLDPEAMLERHRELVWCTISGFGKERPRPGYDFVVQAEGGWMAITGEPHGVPMKTGTALADVVAGKDAAIAILATVFALRAGTSVNRRLFVSLYHSAVACLINVAQNVLVSGVEPTRWGNAHANLVPYELFDASDGALVIAVGNDTQFASLVKVLGEERLADPRFATNAARVANRAEVVALVRQGVARGSVARWVEALDRAAVPCGVVRPVGDALREVGASALTGVTPQAPGMVRRAPPRLDEHGALVREHGWGAFGLV